MAEALKRRYGKGEKSKPFPDLLLVDGGKGQINIAVSIIKELKVNERLEIIGIALLSPGKPCSPGGARVN